jgi:hypothetical protein
MNLAKLLYIDEQGVSVTKYRLRVKNNLYTLKGIEGHQLSVIPPERTPGVIMLLIGTGLTMFSMIFPPSFSGIELVEKFISINSAVFYFGMLLMMIGLGRIVLSRERYALRIATKEGDKNAVVSTKKEYIDEIINALNNASGVNEYANN